MVYLSKACICEMSTVIGPLPPARRSPQRVPARSAFRALSPSGSPSACRAAAGGRPRARQCKKKGGVLRVREPPLPIIISASRPEYGRYAALTSTRRIARQRRKGRRQGCPAFGADAYVVVGFETTARRAFPLAQLVLHLVGPSAPVAQITAVAHACSLSELVACAQDRLPRA